MDGGRILLGGIAVRAYRAWSSSTPFRPEIEVVGLMRLWWRGVLVVNTLLWIGLIGFQICRPNDLPGWLWPAFLASFGVTIMGYWLQRGRD